jgi:hypothetical protein
MDADMHLMHAHRESLLAMMNQLTGNLRSSCDAPAPAPQPALLQQRRRLDAQRQGAALEEGARGSITGSMLPKFAAALPPPQLLSQLDPAASMPLMPDSAAALPMLPSADEPLPSLRPLPGSQGTALLASSFAAPAAQLAPPAVIISPASCPSPPAVLERLSTGATVSSVNPATAAAPLSAPAAATDFCARQQQPSGAAAAEPITMQRGESDFDAQFFTAMRAGSELDPSALLLGPSPAKEEAASDGALRTPLDDCLAQLETGGTPSVLEAEGMLVSLSAMSGLNCCMCVHGSQGPYALLCRCGLPGLLEDWQLGPGLADAGRRRRRWQQACSAGAVYK